MTKESIQENDPTVKEIPNGSAVAGKTRRASHAVEDGFAFTIQEFTRGMVSSCVGKTRPGRFNNSAYHIKKTAMEWVDSFPKKINGVPTGFTSAVKRVFKAVVWSHLMNRGYAVFSYDTLADAADCKKQTAWRAVNFLFARGLIQFKTGKGWGQKERRSLANQYTANFWAFINPETGTIINPPHHTGTYEWEITAAGFRARLRKGPYTENVTMVSKRDAASSGNGAKPDHSNKMLLRSDRQSGVLPPDHSNKMLHYRDNGNGRSASATAAAPSGASASEKKQLNPLPPDSEKVKIKFIQLSELASAIRESFHPEHLIELLHDSLEADERYKIQDVDFMVPWCKDESLGRNPPPNGAKFCHLIIHGDRELIVCTQGESGQIDLWDIGPGDLLAVEYRT